MTRAFMALLCVCVPVPSLHAAYQDEPSVQGKTVGEWTKLLKNPNRDDRIKAADALALLGTKAAPLATALVEAIDDTDVGVRSAANKALLAIGGDAIPALAEGLKHKDWKVRNQLLLILSRMNDKPTTAIPALVTALKDVNERTASEANRYLAASILARSGPDGVAALVKAAQDDDANIRTAVLQSLASSGFVSREDKGKAAAAAIKDKDKLVRQKALDLAAHQGEEGVPILLQGLKDADHDIREAALSKLHPQGPRGMAAKDAVPALREIIKDRNSTIRLQAVKALGAYGLAASDAVEELVALLEEQDAELRQAALGPLVNALRAVATPVLEKKMKTANVAVRVEILNRLYVGQSLLLTALKDPSPEVRVAAVRKQSFQQLAGMEVVKSLLEALEDPDTSVRVAAAEALLRHSQSDKALPVLLMGLDDADSTIREHATQAFAKSGGPTLKTLLTLLKDEDVKARRRSARAIRAIPLASSTTTKPLLPQEDLNALKAALRDEDRQVRREIALALGLGGLVSDPILRVDLKSKNDIDRWGAAETLFQSKRFLPLSTAVELTRLLKDPNGMVRVAAAGALLHRGSGNMGKLKELKELGEALKSEDVAIRREAAALLAPLNVTMTTGSLSKQWREIRDAALKDEDLTVRLHAVESLLSVSSHVVPDELPASAVMVLSEGLAKGTDDQIRFAVRELARVGVRASEAAEPLRKALKHKDAIVRRNATFALGNIGASKATAACLIEVLEDKDLTVRQLAVQSLASVGPEAVEAVPPLVKLLKEWDVTLQLGAVEALGRIGPPAKPAVTGMLDILKQSSAAASTPRRPYVRPNKGDFHSPLPYIAGNARLLVLQALARIGPGAEEAAPFLIDMLKGSTHESRLAVSCLGSIGASAEKALVDGLKNEDASTRSHCIEVLGGLPELAEKNVSLLATAVRDKAPDVRDQALFALQRLGPKAKPALASLLTALTNKANDAETRGLAARAIGAIGPEAREAVGDLWTALKDRHAGVRQRAAAALGDIGPEARDALSALTDLLKDESGSVRRAATRAIDQIQSKP